MHTYGVKRPLDEKKEEIKELYNNSKRYYPSDAKVKVDEWGAVIKNQSEAFKRMEEQQQRDRKEQMRNYGGELESEVYNKLRKNKDSETEQKRMELEMALRKKEELDNLNMANMEKKKMMQNALAQEYEQMMKMKQQKNYYDKITDLQTGQMAVSKANQELQYINQNEANKKKMIQEILNNAKSVHDGVRTQTEKDRYVLELEAKKHLSLMEQRQQDRDRAMLSRYNQFHEFQNKAAQAYTQNVINPKMEKEMQMNQIIRKQEREAKRKAEMEEERKNKMKKDWAMQTRVGQETQIKVKNDGNLANVAEYQYYQGATKSIEHDYNNLKNIDLMEKKARQQQYKDQLDNQKRTKDHMRMYGNMTGIEKQLNKNDLAAFKHYDNKTYAMIPGLNNSSTAPSKKVLEEKMNKKRERSYDEQIDRMNQFGLTRDVTLVKNPALYTTNAHKSSLEDITGHSYKSARVNTENRGVTSPPSASGKNPLLGGSNLPISNFNNHHLYQSYNPISGQYSPEKQAMNQARTTFRYAGSKIIK